MSAQRVGGPGTAARLVRFFEIVMKFMVLGPPIGAAAWLLLLGITDSSSAAFIDLMTFPLAALIAAPFGYLYGAGPAALAGMAIGLKQAFFGRTTWPMALAVGLVSGAVYLEIIGPRMGFRVQRLDGSPFPEYPAMMILTCVIPTMLCWGLVRNWHFARPPAEVAP